MKNWKSIIDKLRDEHELLTEMADSGIVCIRDIAKLNIDLIDYESQTNDLGKNGLVLKEVLGNIRNYWTERIFRETGVFLIMYPKR